LKLCTELHTLFVSNCPGILSLPHVLGDMEKLTRLGWRNGSLRFLDPKGLPSNILHLILTNNRIERFGLGGRRGDKKVQDVGIETDDDNNDDHSYPINSDELEVYYKLKNVRKLMLSHNQLKRLHGDGLKHLRNLELIRIANNQLDSVPDELWTLPNLAWVTISGNPVLVPFGRTKRMSSSLELRLTFPNVPRVHIDQMMTKGIHLGEGASGTVSLYQWKGKDVAVKIIKGVTSDGKAEDEITAYASIAKGRSSGKRSNNYDSDMEVSRIVGCIALLTRDNSIGVSSSEGGSIRGGKDGSGGTIIKEEIPYGIVMESMSNDFRDLAEPPTIVEITKDRWKDDGTYSLTSSLSSSSSPYTPSFVWNVLHDVSTALLYLHGTIGFAHGDVYAHNIKVHSKTGRAFLLDLGASYATGSYAEEAEKVEVRAFGILVGELILRMITTRTTTKTGEDGNDFLVAEKREIDGDDDNAPVGMDFRNELEGLRNLCMSMDVKSRISFAKIVEVLDKYKLQKMV